MAPASSKEFLDFQATVECGFTLKLVRDKKTFYSTKKYLTGTIDIDADNNLTAKKTKKIIREARREENLSKT